MKVEQTFGRSPQSGSITKTTKRVIRNSSFVIASAALLLCASCKKDKDKDDKTEKTVSVTSVSVEPASKTLNLGDKFTPVATVAPRDATNKAVAWASDQPAVATVNSETGEVTAVAAGDAVITATAKDGSKKTGSVAVKVNPAAVAYVAVTGVTLATTTFEAGTPLTLAATVAPSTATNQSIVWSLNSVGKGLTLSHGILNASNAGTVKITATIANGLTEGTPYTQDFDITVTAPYVAVTDITLAEPTFEVGSSPKILFSTVTPANATNKTVVWTIKNDGGTGASFGKGDRFSATAAGTVTLTATITNGATESEDFTQDVIVTVTDAAAAYVPVTGITPALASMVAGTPLTLAATVFPDNATHQTIVWTVKSMSFKGMNAAITDGVLTADLAGTVKVTATIANGAMESLDYKQDFDIAVTADFVPVTDITLATNTYVIGTSPKILFPIVTPSAATHNTIVWSVKDAGGTDASFGKGDRFSATAAGTATITATITNGLTASTDYTQDFTITVIEPYVAVTDITLTSANTLVAGAGQKPLNLTADVTPTNATNQTIAWSITDEGGTGATIDGALHNRLRAYTAGTITVTATITNGKTASTKFTKEFTITATAP